jgi:hypothetical protein
MDTAERVHEALSVRTDRTSRFLLIFAAISLAITLALFAFGYAAEQIRPPTWNPLGVYPQQTVINREHIVHLGGTVDIVARKCAEVDEVAIRGSLQWVPVGHFEATVPVVSGALAIRYRSCGPTRDSRVFSYHNPIPETVAALVAQGFHTWQITGTDVPFDRNGKQGVPRTWITDAFTIT